MRTGRGRGLCGALLVACLAALLAAAAPAAAEWQTPAAVPGAAAVDPGTAVEVGLADDGGAAIAYLSGGAMRVATRETAGGSWSSAEILEAANGASSLDLEMNAAGDIAVGLMLNQAGGLVVVAYRPAGGAWEKAAALDTNTLAGDAGTLDLAINSDGDVIAGWSAAETGAPPRNVIRAVFRQKAAGWPAAGLHQTVVSEDDQTGGGGTIVAPAPCGGPAVAIDDEDRALALWSGIYGSLEGSGGSEEILCALSNAEFDGAGWGPRRDMTTRYAVGYMAKAGDGGFATAPVVASDPVTGAITLAFKQHIGAIDHDGWATVTAAGRVSGGPTDGRETTRAGVAGDLAVGATGGFRAISTVEHADAGAGHAARAAVGRAYFGFPLGTPLTTDDLRSPAIDAGGDSGAFALFEGLLPTRRVVAWTAAPGGSFTGPEVLLENNTTAPAVAANRNGEALFAAGGGTGLLYAEYRSAGDSTEEAPAKPAGITIRRARPTRDGRVRLVVFTPKGGTAAFRGPASVRKDRTLPGPGTHTILLAPKPRAKRVIRRRGKLATRLSVSFAAPGDPVGSVSRGIVFRAPKRGT